MEKVHLNATPGSCPPGRQRDDLQQLNKATQERAERLKRLYNA